MTQQGDKVQFESRSEVVALQVALGIYLQDHKNDTERKEYQAAKKMIDVLDVMYLNW